MSEPKFEQHGVVFYRDFLCESILEFCVRALKAHDPLVVIATADHLAGMKEKLKEYGFDWARLCLAGQAAEYVAEDLLDKFSIDGAPDVSLFREVMEGVVGRWGDRPDGMTIRAFGEMVDILCRRDQAEEAIRLEQMWNELARSHRFTLLCAYSMGNFYREVNGSPFKRICREHDHVVPATATRKAAAG